MLLTEGTFDVNLHLGVCLLPYPIPLQSILQYFLARREIIEAQNRMKTSVLSRNSEATENQSELSGGSIGPRAGGQ